MPASSQGRADVLYGIVIAIFAIAMFGHTFSSRYDNEFLFGDVSTVFFPRLLLGLIVALSLGLALRGARGQGEDALPEINVIRVASTYGAAALAIAGVWFVGYLLAMPIGVFLIGLALGYPNKVILAATSVVAPVLVWIVLAKFAQVSFPAGTLF